MFAEFSIFIVILFLLIANKFSKQHYIDLRNSLLDLQHVKKIVLKTLGGYKFCNYRKFLELQINR